FARRKDQRESGLDLWPVVVPGKSIDKQIRDARGQLMAVKYDAGDTGVGIGEDTLPTRSIPLRIASGEQFGPAACDHCRAGHVKKGTVHRRAAAEHNAIVALVRIRGTAEAEGDEKIVIIAVMNDEGSLHGMRGVARSRGQPIR